MTPKEQAALQQALEALERASAIMDSHAQQRQDDAITALREALSESDWVCDEQDAKVAKRFKRYRAEQTEQEPFKMICPRCKVDRVTTQCPNRGGIGDCPMTATAQSAAPVKSICYQEAYDALEAQLIKEPTGNGLDQVAQNNGLIIAMNTLQKMNLAKQAEGAIVKTCPDGYGTITTEQAEQEPVAWASFDNAYSKACNSSNPQDWMEAALLAQQIRTAPVRTKDLTDGELTAIWERNAGDWLACFRAVIAADREKNRA